MGLIDKFGKLRMKEPVEGTLTVVSVNMPDPSATSQNYRIDGVVSGPGITPSAVVHHGIASVNKWPSSGATLPVTFDATKPERLIVHWDRMPTGREQAVAATQALADAMRTSPNPPAAGTAPQPGSTPGAPSVFTSDIVIVDPPTIDGAPMDPAALSALSALFGTGATQGATGAGNVVHLDAQNPEAAALRDALLRAVAQATNTGTGTGTGPSPAPPPSPS